MSIRVKSKAFRSGLAVSTALSCIVILAGCTSSRFLGTPLTTNSVNTTTDSSTSQTMPNAVAATQLPLAGRYLSASNSQAPYIPAASVGGNNNSSSINSRDPLVSNANSQVQAASNNAQFGSLQPAVTRQLLPSLVPNSVTSTQTMPALPQTASVALASTPTVDNTKTSSISAKPRAVPENSFLHKIEAGESLYVIARNYDVTTDAIVAANGLVSPDKIYVGQEVIIPGRPGMVAKIAAKPLELSQSKTPPANVPSTDQKVEAPRLQAEPVKVASLPAVESKKIEQLVSPTPIARPAGLKLPTQTATPVKPAPTKGEPTTTASVPTKPAPVVATPVKAPSAATGTFRWPVKGRVITDFKGSDNTGLNIEVPEGSTVRAADNGQVVYVGNSVEGFGNLILIRHPSGYVTAYAHLKDINIVKGATVERGDTIGSVGMTGAVSRPQLHFEVREGATPIDPLPLLAS